MSLFSEFTEDVDTKLGYRQSSENRFINKARRAAQEENNEAVLCSPIKRTRMGSKSGASNGKVRKRHIPALKRMEASRAASLQALNSSSRG